MLKMVGWIFIKFRENDLGSFNFIGYMVYFIFNLGYRRYG